MNGREKIEVELLDFQYEEGAKCTVWLRRKNKKHEKIKGTIFVLNHYDSRDLLHRKVTELTYELLNTEEFTLGLGIECLILYTKYKHYNLYVDSLTSYTKYFNKEYKKQQDLQSEKDLVDKAIEQMYKKERWT